MRSIISFRGVIDIDACGWVRSNLVIAVPPITSCATVISLASYRQQQSMRRWSFHHIPVHDGAPACDEYFPASQLVHDEAPACDEYFPAAQPVHSKEFSTENLPAAQVSQSAALEESEILPAAQVSQSAALEESESLPAAQVTQSAALEASENLPASQLVQVRAQFRQANESQFTLCEPAGHVTCGPDHCVLRAPSSDTTELSVLMALDIPTSATKARVVMTILMLMQPSGPKLFRFVP